MGGVPVAGDGLQPEERHGGPIEWEQAKGFSKYLVSTEGQVYSLARDVIIPLYESTSGYMRAYIWNNKGKHKQVSVHRLVYMAHVGDIPKGMQVNHKDENKKNNCVENLELLTPSANVRYGTAIKRMLQTRKLNQRLKSRQ